MVKILRFVGVIQCVLFSTFVAFGQAPAAREHGAAPIGVAAPSALETWEDSLWLPVRRWFKTHFGSTPVVPEIVPTATAFEAEPGCSVAPLQPIDDAAANQLEASTGSNIVDVADMLPAAARALSLFESKVASVGGKMILKSAYRPAAYQKHLQDVWYKWMRELKVNRDSACQVLRTRVQDEFLRHRLIGTQHPVVVSDHTRGLAFDATVDLPAPKKAGRRLTLDGLARLAGLLRPAIAADPVHFKFLGATQARYRALLRRRIAT